MTNGTIQVVSNNIVFNSYGTLYIIPFELYNPTMLNKKYKAKLNKLRRTVEEFYQD